jgi:glycosyltransferase involved in cell wall biosynthesis
VTAQFSLDSRGKKIQSLGVFEPNNCVVVIPCFNEAATLATLVPAVRRHLPQVLAVDDGSTDGTGSIARAAGALVLKHERNLGKGAALKTGLSCALKRGYEWAVTLDGDGQHAPDDLPELFQCAQRTQAPLIIGNRMNQAHKMCWLRRQVNRWMSRQLSRRTARHLPDTQSGFRLIHLETWASMSLETERFETESETLMAFLAAGRRVEFVPVQVIQGRRSSHISPVADSLRWLKWWRKCGRGHGTAAQLNSSFAVRH